jgi:hypothetical protein
MDFFALLRDREKEARKRDQMKDKYESLAAKPPEKCPEPLD